MARKCIGGLGFVLVVGNAVELKFGNVAVVGMGLKSGGGTLERQSESPGTN
jgi:hypothetical protein